MLFPTHDEAVATIGPHEAGIDAVVRRPWSPWATMSAIIDKGHQHEVARRIGFPVPATVTPGDEADIVALSRDLRFPVILKPRYSPEFRRRFRAQVLEAANPEELRRQWELAAEYRPQLSEVIPGADSQLWTLGSYRDAAGRPLASFTGRKLRQWPPRFGTARAAEGRWDADYAARGHILLDALGFHGISQLETKRDVRDGRDYLIEVNPRSWLWIGPRHQLRRQPPLRGLARRDRAAGDMATRGTAAACAGSSRPSTWPGASARSAAGSGRRASSPPRCARRSSTGSSTRAIRARPSPSTAALCGTWGPGVAELRVRIEGVRPAFAPRARWVLETFAEGLGLEPVLVDGPADLVYAPERPSEGVWIPADAAAQAFFEGPEAFPTTAVHRAAGLTLLFAPTRADGPDPRRPRGERLLPARALGRAAGRRARPVRPPAARRQRLRARSPGSTWRIRRSRDTSPLCGARCACPQPTGWSVALTHDIDRIRRRTPKGLAGIARRRGPRGVAAALAGPDPWDNVPDLLEAAWLRGARPTVFLIGRNAHPLDGTPRRIYERERPALAAAVRAAGGEVGLHAAFASSEDGGALAEELAGLRGEVGPVEGVRFHYLRFRYHQTVRWLEAAGAGYDSSLGFSEAPGFAAGIARPFRPYLVGEERPADLVLLPLAVMDTTLHSHLGLDAAAARERALSVLGRVREVGGRVALLWHNTYLADDRAPGYGALWGDLLDELGARGARLGPGRVPGAGSRGPPPRRPPGRAPDQRPPPPRRAHLPQGGARRGRGRRHALVVGAPTTPIRRAKRDRGRLAPGARGPRDATPTSTTSTTPSCCRRPSGWPGPPAAR